MTSGPFLNLSPGEDRIGRACAWIEHEGRVLMVARDAWEECGAHCEVVGEAVRLSEGADCYPTRLLGLESSPEGRPVLWVRPETVWWACDPQLCQVLAAMGRSIPSPALRAGLQTVRRLTFQTQAAFRVRQG